MGDSTGFHALPLDVPGFFDVDVESLDREGAWEILESEVRGEVARQWLAPRLKGRTSELLAAALARVLADWQSSEKVALEVEGPPTSEGAERVALTVILSSDEEGPAEDSLLSAAQAAFQAARGTEIATDIASPRPLVLLKDHGLGEKAASFSLQDCLKTEDEHRFLLGLEVAVSAGALQIRWIHNPLLHRKATVERLDRSFRVELEALASYLTPAPFGEAGLARAALARLTERWDVVDVYPLTPLQEGVLQECLRSQDPSLYLRQKSWLEPGTTDLGKLREAWQYLMDRHPVLRTSFSWWEVPRPVQMVHRHLDLAWEEHDLRYLAPDEQRRQIRSLMAADRQRGLDLGQPPVMRLLALLLRPSVEEGPEHEEIRIVWTTHLALLDSVSTVALLDEMVVITAALERGEEPPLQAPPPFRDFVALQAAQGSVTRAGRIFWSRELSSYTGDTLAKAQGPVEKSKPTEPSRRETKLSVDMTVGLRTLGERQNASLAAVVYAAWGLAVGRASGRHDVVVGTGIRPSLPAGREGMLVGPLTNILPLRIHLPEGTALGTWLRSVATRLNEIREHAAASLAEVRRTASLLPERPMFASVLLFEHELLDERRGRIGVRKTGVPVVVTVTASRELRLELESLREQLGDSFARDLLNRFRQILEALGSAPPETVGKIPWLLPSEREELLVTPSPVSLQRLILRAAPDDDVLPWEHLKQRSAQLAHLLRHRLQAAAEGSVEGGRVVVLLDDEAERRLAVFGALRAGATVILSPSPARLADLAPTVIVTEGEAGVGHGARLSLVDDALEIRRQSHYPPALDEDPQAVAYVSADGKVELRHGEVGGVLRRLVLEQPEDVPPLDRMTLRRAAAALGGGLDFLEILVTLVGGRVVAEERPLATGDRAPFEAPLSPLERLVTEVFAEELDTTPIGRLDDFFSLGGHSLHALRTVARLRRVTDISLELTKFVERPTPASVAAQWTVEPGDDPLAEWRQRLEGAVPVRLPIRERPEEDLMTNASAGVQLSAATVAALDDLGPVEGTTGSLTLLAVFVVFLAEICEQQDIVVVVPTSGGRRRGRVVRVELAGELPFREVLERTRAAAIHAFRWPVVDLESLADQLGTDLFRVAFEIDRRDSGGHGGARFFDLVLDLRRRDDTIVGGLRYADELFRDVTVRHMARRFSQVLKRCLGLGSPEGETA